MTEHRFRVIADRDNGDDPYEEAREQWMRAGEEERDGRRHN